MSQKNAIMAEIAGSPRSVFFQRFQESLPSLPSFFYSIEPRRKINLIIEEIFNFFMIKINEEVKKRAIVAKSSKIQTITRHSNCQVRAVLLAGN